MSSTAARIDMLLASRNKQRIEREVIEIVSTRFETANSQVVSNTSFRGDLGVNEESLQSLLESLADIFECGARHDRVAIDRHDVRSVTTVADAVRLIVHKKYIEPPRSDQKFCLISFLVVAAIVVILSIFG